MESITCGNDFVVASEQHWPGLGAIPGPNGRGKTDQTLPGAGLLRAQTLDEAYQILRVHANDTSARAVDIGDE